MARTKKSLKLKKTLSRKTEFRPIEQADVDYVGVAYRKGALREVFKDDLSPEEFKATFVSLILDRYDAAWTLFAESEWGFKPIGLSLGFWPHPEADTFMVMDAFVWFPWATPRNRFESSVGFLTKIREDIPMLGFVRPEDKKFVETIARHGVLNRVGTSYNIFPGERASIWETRGA